VKLGQPIETGSGPDPLPARLFQSATAFDGCAADTFSLYLGARQGCLAAESTEFAHRLYNAQRLSINAARPIGHGNSVYVFAQILVTWPGAMAVH